MTNSLKLFGATAVALCLSLPAYAQDKDTVVATVNGKEITLGHMLMARASLPEQYQSIPNGDLWNGIIQQLIQQEALAQDERAEETARVRIALDNERRSLLASEVIAGVAKDASTDEALKAAYEEQYLNVEQGKEYNASHILVETEEEAAAIVAELEGGADFAQTASEKSTGPSGPNGGALGWFGPGMMVPEFEQAVTSLEVGAVSAPVQTQFGWHVIKLSETRTSEAPSFDTVRGELEQAVQRKAVEDHINALLDTGEVTRAEGIDPEVLSNIDLLED